MRIVQIDLNKLILRFTPVDLIKAKWLALVRVLLVPFATAHAVFLAYRADSNAKAKLNGQTQILENLLNRRVPSGGGLIRIVNSSLRLDAAYLFNSPELQPDTYADNASEGTEGLFLSGVNEGRNLYDFIVQVPASVPPTDRQIVRALVNQYRLATKRFEIRVA
jgi:hypothetical protein